MGKYLVGLETGGLMESPEIEYRDFDVIEAISEDEAVRIYNEKHRCSFYYGTIIRRGMIPDSWYNEYLPLLY